MNSARTIMWCLCLGVWLAVVTVLCTWGLPVAHLVDDWRYLFSDDRAHAPAVNPQALDPSAKADCLTILREGRSAFLIMESARKAADLGWKEAIPLLRRLYTDEMVLHRPAPPGMLEAVFVPLCRLEGRPIDRLQQARDNIQGSYSAPSLPWIIPNAACFARCPAKSFILHCKDTEAAAYVAIELAYLKPKYPDNKEAIEREGRRLLSHLPREAALPFLDRIRRRMGTETFPRDRQTVDELRRICGRSSARYVPGLGAGAWVLEFVLGLGLVCLALGYLGLRCLVECYRRIAHERDSDGKEGSAYVNLCVTHGASCIALLAACWAPVATRAWVMLALARLEVQESPLLIRATQSPIHDIAFTLMFVSTPALLYESIILRRLRRREKRSIGS